MIMADRMHLADGQYDIHESWLRLDGDHSGEPCHAFVLHYGHYGRTTIEETAVCTERDRHSADGDSPLKVPAARPESDEERAEREAAYRAEQEERRAGEIREVNELSARLAALPDEAVIGAVLRMAARDVLRAARFEDPLLPVPERFVDPDENWKFPSQVIDAAPSGNLARVVVRHWLQMADTRYYYDRRKLVVIHEVADMLPPPPGDGDDPDTGNRDTGDVGDHADELAEVA